MTLENCRTISLVTAPRVGGVGWLSQAPRTQPEGEKELTHLHTYLNTRGQKEKVKETLLLGAHNYSKPHFTIHSSPGTRYDSHTAHNNAELPTPNPQNCQTRQRPTANLFTPAARTSALNTNTSSYTSSLTSVLNLATALYTV